MGERRHVLGGVMLLLVSVRLAGTIGAALTPGVDLLPVLGRLFAREGLLLAVVVLFVAIIEDYIRRAQEQNEGSAFHPEPTRGETNAT